jgi:hypothetical protein
MLETVGRACAMLAPELQSPVLLPGLSLVHTPETHLSYLVSALLINRGHGPKGVQHQDIRCLEIDVKSGLETSGWKCNVREDGGREGAPWKVVDEGVVEFEGRVGVADGEAGVINLNNIELSEKGRELPVVLVGHRAKLGHEGHFQLRSRVYVVIRGLEGADGEFQGLLVAEVRQLVGPYQPNDAPVVDSQDGRDIKVPPRNHHCHVCKIIVGHEASVANLQVVTVSRVVP